MITSAALACQGIVNGQIVGNYDDHDPEHDDLGDQSSLPAYSRHGRKMCVINVEGICHQHSLGHY